MTRTIAIIASLALAMPALAQTPAPPTQTEAPGSSAAPEPLPPEAPPEPETWEFSLGATVISTEDDTYLQPIFTADRDWLHLEARYNYEDRDTGSLWAGYNLSFGETVTFEFTPMVGAVMGDTRGVAPGYELTVGWRMFEFYTEGEYLFSTETSDDNFFYSWSEWVITPIDWLYLGVAFQRTQAYDSGRELDVGPLVGVSFKSFDASVWILNAEDDEPIFGFSLGFAF